MIKVLFEEGLFVEKEDLIRLTSILDWESELIYKQGIIKTFIENIEKDNGELKDNFRKMNLRIFEKIFRIFRMNGKLSVKRLKNLNRRIYYKIRENEN